ncbi:VOC family protein [Streptococcus sp. X16XC17]|uniref:VOC family protein n=1 Tax=unclassified Streptococcus TaxID=2608887 RepID=UPI00066FE9FC|nr:MULTISPECIES: VOC family protein [unclassified Streptococcus]TCD45424.1 VOC family protein [Streptococcus sp. X16XC17]
MNLNQTDLLVSHVAQATAQLKIALDIQPDYADEHFAQFTIGQHCLMLTDKAPVPMTPIHSGTILHFQVENVDQELERLKAAGQTVLCGPQKMDWGTYSLLIQGPDQIVLDFYSFV